MREFTLLELALKAFPQVSKVSLRLAKKTHDRTLGKFACYLTIFQVGMESNTLAEEQIDSFEQCIEDTLDLIELACGWPRNPKSKEYPTLKDLVNACESRSDKDFERVASNIQQSLYSFIRTPFFDNLIRRLEKGVPSSTPTMEDMGLHSSEAKDKDNIPGYPKHVNEALYLALSLHTVCSCRNPHLGLARLRLDSNEQDEDEGNIPFEIDFTGSPSRVRHSNANEDAWHKSKILVSRRRPPKRQAFWPSEKRECFQGTDIDIGSFCNHLSENSGVLHRFRVTVEGDEVKLRKLIGYGQPLRKVTPVRSLSLGTILQDPNFFTRPKERFSLAYLIAKSVWQFYNSDWMKSPWTHEDIHFLEEQGPKEQGCGGFFKSYHPYFLPKFQECNTNTDEYYTKKDVLLMHRYPKVLALGIMLIEIIRGQPFNPGGHIYPFNGAKIRQYYNFAWRQAAGNGLACNVLYKDALNKCLSQRLFDSVPFDKDNPRKDLDGRRDILYKEIVLPLKKLLNMCNGMSDIDYPDENERAAWAPVIDPEAEYSSQRVVFLTESSAKTEIMKSVSWLERFERVRIKVKKSLAELNSSASPMKIAILDTGCDLSAQFFAISPRSVMRVKKNWHDCVESSFQPKDDDKGRHGTHLVTLLLQLLPQAEIFVVRVAKDDDGLQSSEKNIAAAITHAANVCNVDMIVMSFGLSAEVELIIQAISDAERVKKDSILFFAAAANDGANTKEMFPASYSKSVISVRGTNSDGGFVDAYNPDPGVTYRREFLFGTLSESVPCGWPPDGTTAMSGCSVATPILAAIAALFIHYAACASQENEKGLIRRLWSRDGIVELFRMVSGDRGKARYIAPWLLFDKPECLWLSNIKTALGNLPERE